MPRTDTVDRTASSGRSIARCDEPVAAVGHDGPVQVSRVAGGLAAVVAAGAMVLLATAVVATQGLLYPGFVSETGVPGSPHVTAYRWGIYLIGIALVLLSLALAARGSVLAPGLLAASGALAGVSGSVSCTAGCPLPPFATATTQDLVHGAASTIGVGLAGLAMLLLAARRRPGPLRRLSRAFLWPVIPLGATVAVALVFIGRGWTIGLTERSTIAVILLWMMLLGAILARPQPTV